MWLFWNHLGCRASAWRLSSYYDQSIIIIIIIIIIIMTQWYSQPHHLFPRIRPGRDGRREERRDDRGRFDDRRGERPGVVSLYWCGKRGQFMWWSIQFHWQSRMKLRFILKRVEFYISCKNENAWKSTIWKWKFGWISWQLLLRTCWVAICQVVDQATGGILLDVDPRDASKQGTVDPIRGRKFRWNSFPLLRPRHEGILCPNERMNDFDAVSRIPKNTEI